VLFAALISCDNSDEDRIVNDFKGFYRINTISSSTPIDMNNDGLKSTDYLAEIKSDYIAYDGRVINYLYNNLNAYNFTESRPTKYHEDNVVPFLILKVPVQYIDSVYRGINNYEIMNMRYDNILPSFIYKLTPDNVEIDSDPSYLFDYYGITNFNINRLNKREFEIDFDFKAYDFTDDEWLPTNLTVRYEIVEE
jgi:hypothetical protein